MQEETPNTPSSDHAAMADYWELAETLMGGTKAIRAQTKYLPKYENETQPAYDLRRKNAKFTNIYRDIVENLAQRPFASEVQVEETAPASIKAFIEDVDGRGNHLHVFAGETFFAGINAAIDWIMVDFTKASKANATKADEKRMGVRPYWVRIPASSVLAAYSAIIDGKEEFVHVRINEPVTVRDGFKEKTIERVRVLDREAMPDGSYGPAKYQVWEKQKNGSHGKEEWVETDDRGPISIGVIPLVPFITGRRIGGSWRLHPPMRDAADLQVEHYQQESALKHIEELTAFPMLAGNGVSPPIGDNGKPMAVPVGPQAVLYAPPHGDKASGSWNFIEPGSESLNFLLKHIEQTAQELRELGRQPLTAQSGNLTVITTAFAAQKGNSAIQAWALNLKDALERAFALTLMWLKESGDVEVKIDTDFDLGMGDDDSFEHVMAMASGDDPLISRETAISEAKRRNILSAEFDQEKDELAIIKDMNRDHEPTDPDADADGL